MIAGDAEAALVKALLTHHSEVGDDGRLTDRQDAETLVTGLGVALLHPTHGGNNPDMHSTYVCRDGREVFSRLVANDPYLDGYGRVAGTVQ
jgi:hypothetical protein